MSIQYRRARMPVIGIMFGSVALGACMLDDGEQLQTGTSAQPILLNINESFQAQCEGFTSGGGQKVRGHVQMALVPSPVNPQLWRVRVEVWAQNWKKNIGWNTKRTAELQITGTTTLLQPGVFQVPYPASPIVFSTSTPVVSSRRSSIPAVNFLLTSCSTTPNPA